MGGAGPQPPGLRRHRQLLRPEGGADQLHPESLQLEAVAAVLPQAQIQAELRPLLPQRVQGQGGMVPWQAR